MRNHPLKCQWRLTGEPGQRDPPGTNEAASSQPDRVESEEASQNEKFQEDPKSHDIMPKISRSPLKKKKKSLVLPTIRKISRCMTKESIEGKMTKMLKLSDKGFKAGIIKMLKAANYEHA